MDEYARVVDVEFSGLSSGTGDLTAGQRYIWDIIEALVPHDEHLNIPLAVDVAGDTSLAEVLAVLRQAVERFDTLHTVFPRHADGEPYQRVDGSGVVPVTLHDVTECADVDAETQRFISYLGRRRYDTTQPGLLRAGVLTVRSQPRRLVLSMSHMLVDSPGARALGRWFRRRLGGDGQDRQWEPEREWQPMDQLAFEQSPDGRQTLAEALAYWSAQLASAPVERTPPSAGAASSPRYWHGALDAPAATVAAARLARHWTGALSSNSVLLAAAGLLHGHVSGGSDCLLVMRVSNRTPGPTHNAVGHYSQAAPVRFDLTTGTFSDLTREVQRTARTAHQNGRYQPRELTALLVELGRARRSPVDVLNTFNCLREPMRGPDVDPAGQPRPAPSHVTWLDKREVESIKTFLYAHPGDQISLFADTAYLAPDRIEAYLRSIERVLVAADDGQDSMPALRGLIDV